MSDDFKNYRIAGYNAVSARLHVEARHHEERAAELRMEAKELDDKVALLEGKPIDARPPRSIREYMANQKA